MFVYVVCNLCVCVCVCVGFLMCGFVYVCILYCVVVCMCGFCNVWVCVCVSGGGVVYFANCVGVLVIYVLVFTVFLYFFLYVCLFLFVFPVLVQGLLPPSNNPIAVTNY